MTTASQTSAILDRHGQPARRNEAAPRRRQLDAAGSGARWQKAPMVNDFGAEAIQGGDLIRRRAAYFARNNPAVVSAVSALKADIVGEGMRPQPRHPDRGVRETLSAAWDEWTAGADITGRQSFAGLQSLMIRQVIEYGEALVRIRVKRGELRLQALAPDQLPFHDHRELDNGHVVRAGIEHDTDGEPVAFHLYRARPGERWRDPLEQARFPANEILHVFNQMEPGQPRGVTWLLPILLTLLEVDQYDDATTIRQKVAAMAAGAVIDMNNDQTGVTNQSGGFAEASWEPGMLFRLDPGQDIRWFNPPDTGNYQDFIKQKLRIMAGGMGATYQQMSGDYSDANYSSLRAMFVEHRRQIRQVQQQIMAHQFLRPVWNAFVQWLAVRGEISAADLDRNPRRYGAAWLAPRFEAADPKKDIEAELAELNAGLKSRAQAAQERGISVEELDRQIAAERERARELGLTFTNIGVNSQTTDPST